MVRIFEKYINNDIFISRYFKNGDIFRKIHNNANITCINKSYCKQIAYVFDRVITHCSVFHEIGFEKNKLIYT
jgi:hypothetical protein